MLMQVGGPSQVMCSTPKTELQKRDAQEYSGDVETLQPGSRQQANGQPVSIQSPWPLRHGNIRAASGDRIGCDDVCLVRSMVSDNNNHPQATRCLNTGKIFPGRPVLGSWGAMPRH